MLTNSYVQSHNSANLIIEARNETATTRQPNALGLPGYIGKNSPFKGYPKHKNTTMNEFTKSVGNIYGNIKCTIIIAWAGVIIDVTASKTQNRISAIVWHKFDYTTRCLYWLWSFFWRLSPVSHLVLYADIFTRKWL